MRITLENDAPVPVLALKRFFTAELSKDKLPSLVQSRTDRVKSIVNKDKRETAQDTASLLAQLRVRVNGLPEGSVCWFVKWFLSPFGGQKTPEAIQIFEKLRKTNNFKVLEREASAWAANQQKEAAAVARACSASLRVLLGQNGIVEAGKALSAALNKAVPTQPQPIAEGSLKSLVGLLGRGLITPEDYVRYERRLLAEAAPPPPRTALRPAPNVRRLPAMPRQQAAAVPAPAPAPVANQLGEVTKLLQDIHNHGEVLATTLGSLQQLTVDLAKGFGTVSPESSTVQENKQQLNEFLLLGALVAAAALVTRWAAKKFVFTQGGQYWEGTGTKAPSVTAEQVSAAVNRVGSAEVAAISPQGLVTADNKRAIPTDQAAKSKSSLLFALNDSNAMMTSVAQRVNAMQEKLAGTNIAAAVGLQPNDPRSMLVNQSWAVLVDSTKTVQQINIPGVIAQLKAWNPGAG